MNCYTFRVEPYQVTWRIDSELIKPDFTYLRMNGSELLYGVNQTYKQYISLEGSFSNGTIISCSTTVNGETEVEAKYVLQGILHDAYTVKKLCYLFHCWISCLISSNWVISLDSIMSFSLCPMELSVRC